MSLLITMILVSLYAKSQELKAGEYATQADGSPALIGQCIDDHLFVRMDYDDLGTMQTYDNIVSFKSGNIQTVWIWLNDDGIYLNDKVQALTPFAYDFAGNLYNEITYDSFQCNIYLPLDFQIVGIQENKENTITLQSPCLPKSVVEMEDCFLPYNTEIIEQIKSGNILGGDYAPYYKQGPRMPNSSDFSFGEQDWIKTIDGINYRVYTILLTNGLSYGRHLSAKDGLEYKRHGALKKNDGAVLGINIQKQDVEGTEGRLSDMIIANQEFGILETLHYGWEPNEYRFIYGTGGNNVEQRFQLYSRVALYGSNGIDDWPDILSTSVSLNLTSAEMITGGNLQLTATVLPENATNKTIIWSTTNSAVATVSSDGLVTAKAPGNVTITATTTDGSNLSAMCSITVVPQGPNISFADANVKEICVQNWDTDRDGELSYDEAAAVTNLSTVFQNKYITSFEELQYFTGLESIESSAFDGCSGLTSVAIPNAVISIGDYAFWGCSGITSINIPNSVRNIGLSAFAHCTGLTNVNIPNSVTEIGGNEFIGCNVLANVFVDSGNTMYDSRNNCNAIIETSTNTLISGCKSTVISNSVTSIGNYAFYGCSGLTSINIPNSVTSIGNYAFWGCSGMTSVNIPNSVTSIGSSAFRSCTSLDTLNFNAVSCADFSSTANYLPFYNLNISTINFGESVQKIPANFANGLTNLKSITIPNSVTSIGSNAFYNCSGLTSVNISDLASWCSISFSSFFANPLSHAHNLYLNGAIITNLVIPNSVTEIGDYAFNGCSGLTNVTIPNSVTEIGNQAFFGCSALETLNFNAISCADFNSTYLLYNLSISSINFGDSVQRIPTNFAYGLTKLTSLTIPNSVTEIGDCAFNGCSGLTNVTIPNSVISIGRHAFDGCSGLISVTIGNSVTEIGNNAFSGCTGLTMVDISDLAAWCRINFVTATTNPLFYAQHLYLNDNEVMDLVVPDDVGAIGDYAFINCSGLTSVTIPNSVTSVGEYAFNGCSGLTRVSLSESVTSIGKQAFYNSPAIETVTCMAAAPPAWDDIAMFTTNVYNHTPLYVPMGSKRAYIVDQCWGQFATIIGKEIQDDVLATGISLNQSQMSMIVGSNSLLTATVLPDSTTNKTVNWTSSAPAVATVDDNGLVTAVAPGTATITATTTDGSDLSASCVVTVTEDLSDYDNYLSLNDVEAFHGDTIVIPVAMTNAESIIAFQTDIFLPDGLEIVQEDGDYMIDPSSRMTRTHTIMSNQVSSGAVRVICYSSNYKPFTGNSGDDLFYITVKVADDAEGDYTIQLKNTLLTNTDFVDLVSPDVAANVNVKAYLLGDANNSGSVTVTDVVVTAQYVLELNPNPFIYDAADVNFDGNITVADVSRIAWMVLNPTLNVPKRAPALRNNGDSMSGEGITLAAGETRTVSIALDNETDYSAFQLDLTLPDGLTASNFALTDRAGSHAFDVNTLKGGKTRALCYSPVLTAIRGHEGAVLTFDVTATAAVDGAIQVDGIELVTTGCQSVLLDGFAIGVTNASSVNEVAVGKTVARVDYFNVAGQHLDRPESGVTLVVTTYTDGTRTTTKLIR